LGIIILIIMSSVAYLESEASKGDGTPSSYSNLRRGAKAAYMILQQSGHPVERWERSPKELPADGQGMVLIVADPSSYANTEEMAALSRFLTHGGSILVAGFDPESFVAKSATKFADTRFGGAECKPVTPTGYTRGGSISMDGYLAWNSSDSSQLV